MTTKLPIEMLMPGGIPNSFFGINASGRIIEQVGGVSDILPGTLQYTDSTTFTAVGGPVINKDTGQSVFLGTLTKSVNALFAQGNNNGCMEAAKVGGGCYHVYVIRRDATLDGDIFCSLSITPTIPVGWTLIKRVGSISLTGAGVICNFRQVGKRFFFVGGNQYQGPQWSVSRNYSFTAEYTVNAPRVPNGVPVTIFAHYRQYCGWMTGKLNYYRLASGTALPPNTAQGSVYGLLGARHAGYPGNQPGGAMSGLLEIYNPASNSFIVGLQGITTGSGGGGTPYFSAAINIFSYIDHSI